VFLDYDGTLTPIVDSPEKAMMSEEIREVLEVISKHWRVAVISERDLNDVKKMVRTKNICYAGSHGFDIECTKKKT
jgi:Trehalose-6-phosphatase